jgi:hypothetical protein
MKLLFCLLLSLVTLAACEVRFSPSEKPQVASDQGTPEDRQQALEAADTFLVQLDKGRVKETWANTSSQLKQRASETAWIASLSAMRAPFGSVVSRKLESYGFTDTVEDLPKGRYAVFQMKGDFSGTSLEEKVVLHKDGNDWRILGYFLTKRFN